MDIQSLNRLKGKKSKETDSGPITKLSADEWNTLVQGVIDHYIDNPYSVTLNSENNVITFTDISGNTSTYELTPYEEAEWQTPTLTIPTTGRINNVSYNLNSIPDSGGDLSITLSYSQNKTKGQTVIDTVTSGGDITYTDLNGDAQTISNHGKTITVTIPQNSDSTTKSFTLTNVKVTINEKVSTTKTISVTQKAHEDPNYYVGLYSDKTSFENATDSQLLNNAEGKNTSVTPTYPSATGYKMFSSDKKLMYILLKQDINTSNITVDINNPGSDLDINGESFTLFTKEDRIVVIDDINYDVYRRYKSTYTNQNGLRINFNV